MPKTLRVHRSAVAAAGTVLVAALVAVGFAPSHPTTQTRPLVKPAAHCHRHGGKAGPTPSTPPAQPRPLVNPAPTCHGNGVKACPTTSTTTTSSTTTSPTTTTTTT